MAETLRLHWERSRNFCDEDALVPGGGGWLWVRRHPNEDARPRWFWWVDTPAGIRTGESVSKAEANAAAKQALRGLGQG